MISFERWQLTINRPKDLICSRIYIYTFPNKMPLCRTQSFLTSLRLSIGEPDESLLYPGSKLGNSFKMDSWRALEDKLPGPKWPVRKDCRFRDLSLPEKSNAGCSFHQCCRISSVLIWVMHQLREVRIGCQYASKGRQGCSVIPGRNNDRTPFTWSHILPFRDRISPTESPLVSQASGVRSLLLR